MKNVQKALNYVREEDGVQAGVLEVLSDSDKKIKIIEGEEMESPSAGSKASDPVKWNAYTGFTTRSNDRKPDGGSLSPAMGLYHELTHKFRQIYEKKDYQRDKATPD